MVPGILTNIQICYLDILFVLCATFELKCPDGVTICQARKHRFNVVVNIDQQSDQIRIIRGFTMSVRVHFFVTALGIVSFR